MERSPTETYRRLGTLVPFGILSSPLSQRIKAPKFMHQKCTIPFFFYFLFTLPSFILNLSSIYGTTEYDLELDLTVFGRNIRPPHEPCDYRIGSCHRPVPFVPVLHHEGMTRPRMIDGWSIPDVISGKGSGKKRPARKTEAWSRDSRLHRRLHKVGYTSHLFY